MNVKLDPTEVHVLGGGFKPILNQQLALASAPGVNGPGTWAAGGSTPTQLAMTGGDPGGQQAFSGIEAYVQGVW